MYKCLIKYYIIVFYNYIIEINIIKIRWVKFSHA